MLTLTEDVFGSARDPISETVEAVRRFTFTNENKMIVQVITLGATITSIKVPDHKGVVEDVVLGFDDIEGYVNPKTNPYFGATVGRVANRIGNGNFFLNGCKIKVSQNLNDKHMLHGGYIGFNSVLWSVVEFSPDNCSLKLQHVSPDRHEGFPGKVTASVFYQLTPDNCLRVRFTANTTRPTPINMTNHSYFNLAGHGAGKGSVYDTKLVIKADKITVTDEDSIPTGQLMDVEGTPYDLRGGEELGQNMMKMAGDGFDNNYCVNLENNGITVVAKATEPKSGRWMEVASDQPGLQFYTGNSLPEMMIRPIIGKGGAYYVRQCAFCLETQGYPDAVNQPNFPSIIVKPGEIYEHNVIYKFGVVCPVHD